MAFCSNCGSKLDDSVKFCESCGAPVKNTVNNIPAPKYKKTMTNESKKQAVKKKKRAPSIIVILILGLTLIGGGVFVVLKILESQKPSIKPASQLMKESFNVKDYFKVNSDIKSVDSVKNSKNSLSESNVVAELRKRGFNDYPVTYNYSMNGEYSGSQTASETSDEKHPVYETYYVTAKEEVWIISVIDGTIMATPSSYNMAHSEKVAVLLSESNEIVSYDSSSNSFYRTIPKSTALDVRVVDKIDAKTLEAINLEG